METGNWQGKQEIEHGSKEWIAERDRILMAWETSKTVLEKAKADEMSLRKQFVQFSFNPDKKEGTERIELGNGYEAKTVKKLSYKLVSTNEGVPVHEAVNKMLDQLEEASEEGAFIAKRLVKWTCELAKSEYTKLEPDLKKIADTVIETVEGAPTLEIIAPKGSKK